MPSIFVGRIQGAAPTQVSVGVTSASAVSANETRVGLTLTNLSTGTVYLSFGQTAVLGAGIPLLANGGVWSMDEYHFSKEAVNAIAHVASSTLAVQEFNQ